MARSKRKRCMVWINEENPINPEYPHLVRCEGKIKPGTTFCKKHFETHRIVVKKCTGEAHSNPFIDHCGVCMPNWGSYPVAIPKDLPLPEGCSEPD